jgi:hypothetical protein
MNAAFQMSGFEQRQHGVGTVHEVSGFFADKDCT